MRNEIFDTHTVVDLGHALRDSNLVVRENSLGFFIAAIAHGISFHLRGEIMLIFTEDFRDKLFDAEITAALERARNDRDSSVRKSMFNVFTAAIAQGVLHCFFVIRIPKYSQMVFGTRYSTLTSLLHLYMHSVIQILMSEAMQSNFSLLLQLKVHFVVFMG